MAWQNLYDTELIPPEVDRRATIVIRSNEPLISDSVTTMADEINDSTFDCSSHNSTSSSLGSKVVSENEETMTSEEVQVQEALQKVEIREDSVNYEREITSYKEKLKHDHKEEKAIGKTQQKKQTEVKKITKGNTKNSKAISSKKAVENVEDICNIDPDHPQEEVKTKRAKKGKKEDTDLVQAPNTGTNLSDNELPAKMDSNKASNNKVPDRVTIPEIKSNKPKRGVRGNLNKGEENNTEDHAKPDKKEDKTHNPEIELTDEDGHKTRKGRHQPIIESINNQEKNTAAKTKNSKKLQKQNNDVKEKTSELQKKDNSKVSEDNVVVDVKTDANEEVTNNVENKSIRLTRAQQRNALSELKEINNPVKEPTLEQHPKANLKKGSKRNKENIVNEGNVDEVVKNLKNKTNNPERKVPETSENATKETKNKTKPKDMPKEKVAVRNKKNKSANEEVGATKRVTRKQV